uniref:Coat protein n=1 Tax=Pernambuco nodavirus TaxID=2565391 RepID=A0A4V1EJX1_9VIRU|nr:coat protein [Pernambuco nodavirus]
MGMTPDTASAVEALPREVAKHQLRRLARYTAAMAGNEKVDMADVPVRQDPEFSQEDFSNVSDGLREPVETQKGDTLTVLHPEPYTESRDPTTGELLILKKGSKTVVTQKYIVHTTSDGHVYRIKRGTFGAMVPASAFPAMVHYMQQKKEDLEARAKALEVVLAASDKTLGPSAAEWVHVLLTTYVMKPTPENKAALSAAINEFWQTAKLGRSAAWDGIARRYNSALGGWAFVPSWLRPATNPDGSIDGAKRVAEISYAAAASGARVTKEHGITTIKLGSSILSKTFDFATRTSKATANVAKRAAKRAAKVVSELPKKVDEVANEASENTEFGSTFFQFLTEVKAVFSAATRKVSTPFTKLWKWLSA